MLLAKMLIPILNVKWNKLSWRRCDKLSFQVQWGLDTWRANEEFLFELEAYFPLFHFVVIQLSITYFTMN